MIPVSLSNEVLGTLEGLDMALEHRRRAQVQVDGYTADLRGYCLHNPSLNACLKVDMALLRRVIQAAGEMP
jgi:hypothetical protein